MVKSLLKNKIILSILTTLLVFIAVASLINIKKSPVVEVMTSTEMVLKYINNYSGQKIELFDSGGRLLSNSSIETIKQAYQDLVNLRDNPKDEQQIDQKAFYAASSELKELKRILLSYTDCDENINETRCADKIKTEKASAIYKQIITDISVNKKIPYTNAKEYFYAVSDTIFN